MTTINMRNSFIAIFAMIVTASIGCQQEVATEDSSFDGSSTNENDGTVSNNHDVTPSNSNTLSGVVIDAFGQPLSGVLVSVAGEEASVETDADGKFYLQGLETSDRAIVNFRKDMYARASTPVAIIEDIENNIIQRMASVDHAFTFESSEGYLFIDETFKLELLADNIIDAEGNAYDGSVVTEITIFDLMSPADEGNELLATPGDFTAVDATGESKVLESFGMVQVNLTTPEGVDLQIGASSVPVRLPVQNLGEPPIVGDEIAAWSYDENTGKWLEEAIGVVTEFEGELVWEFEAPHFSTWNCDRPISTHGCLTGNVTDSMGTPRTGATVRAIGITYISTTTARTSQDGSFCLEVKNGETVWAEISYSIAGQTATQRTDPVSIPAGQASCSLGEGTCVDLGEIPVDIQTCVSGIVVDSQNMPIIGAQVMSTSAGIGTTDDNGSFCLTTPVFNSAPVFVLSEPGEMMYKPQRAYAQPGLPGCQSGCPNQLVIRPYESFSCVTGDVVVDEAVGSNVLVEVYDMNFPEARIGSVLTSTDGTYCSQVPNGTMTSVQVGSSADPCAYETLGDGLISGAQCGDTGQNAECYNLETLMCSL